MSPSDHSFILVERRRIYADGSSGRESVYAEYGGYRYRLDARDHYVLNREPISHPRSSSSLPLPMLQRIGDTLRKIEESPQ